MGIHVTGLREVQVRLNGASRAAVPLLRSVVEKSTREVEADAKSLAPVDTGALRSSIASTISGGGSTITGEVQPGVNYAIYQEMGTSRMAAQPFLFPALERQAGPFQAAVAQVMGRVL